MRFILKHRLLIMPISRHAKTNLKRLCNWARKTTVESSKRNSMKFFLQSETILISSKTIPTSWKIFGYSFLIMWRSKTLVNTASSSKRTIRFTFERSLRTMSFKRSSKRHHAGLEQHMHLKYLLNTSRKSSRLNKIVNSCQIPTRISTRRLILSSISMSTLVPLLRDYSSSRSLRRGTSQIQIHKCRTIHSFPGQSQPPHAAQISKTVNSSKTTIITRKGNVSVVAKR